MDSEKNVSNGLSKDFLDQILDAQEEIPEDKPDYYHIDSEFEEDILNGHADERDCYNISPHTEELLLNGAATSPAQSVLDDPLAIPEEDCSKTPDPLAIPEENCTKTPDPLAIPEENCRKTPDPLAITDEDYSDSDAESDAQMNGYDKNLLEEDMSETGSSSSEDCDKESHNEEIEESSDEEMADEKNDAKESDTEICSDDSSSHMSECGEEQDESDPNTNKDLAANNEDYDDSSDDDAPPDPSLLLKDVNELTVRDLKRLPPLVCTAEEPLILDYEYEAESTKADTDDDEEDEQREACPRKKLKRDFTESNQIVHVSRTPIEWRTAFRRAIRWGNSTLYGFHPLFMKSKKPASFEIEVKVLKVLQRRNENPLDSQPSTSQMVTDSPNDRAPTTDNEIIIIDEEEESCPVTSSNAVPANEMMEFEASDDDVILLENTSSGYNEYSDIERVFNNVFGAVCIQNMLFHDCRNVECKPHVIPTTFPLRFFSFPAMDVLFLYRGLKEFSVIQATYHNFASVWARSGRSDLLVEMIFDQYRRYPECVEVIFRIAVSNGLETKKVLKDVFVRVVPNELGHLLMAYCIRYGILEYWNFIYLLAMKADSYLGRDLMQPLTAGLAEQRQLPDAVIKCVFCLLVRGILKLNELPERLVSILNGRRNGADPLPIN